MPSFAVRSFLFLALIAGCVFAFLVAVKVAVGGFSAIWSRESLDALWMLLTLVSVLWFLAMLGAFAISVLDRLETWRVARMPRPAGDTPEPRVSGAVEPERSELATR